MLPRRSTRTTAGRSPITVPAAGADRAGRTAAGTRRTTAGPGRPSSASRRTTGVDAAGGTSPMDPAPPTTAAGRPPPAPDPRASGSPPPGGTPAASARRAATAQARSPARSPPLSTSPRRSDADDVAGPSAARRTAAAPGRLSRRAADTADAAGTRRSATASGRHTTPTPPRRSANVAGADVAEGKPSTPAPLQASAWREVGSPGSLPRLRQSSIAPAATSLPPRLKPRIASRAWGIPTPSRRPLVLRRRPSTNTGRTPRRRTPFCWMFPWRNWWILRNPPRPLMDLPPPANHRPRRPPPPTAPRPPCRPLVLPPPADCRPSRQLELPPLADRRSRPSRIYWP